MNLMPNKYDSLDSNSACMDAFDCQIFPANRSIQSTEANCAEKRKNKTNRNYYFWNRYNLLTIFVAEMTATQIAIILIFIHKYIT